jgi:hypothetical protein
MRTNLKAILAAAATTALLASPVMAKTHHSHASSAEDVSGAQGAATFRRDYQTPSYGPVNEGGPYTPSIREPAHGQNHDFQDDARGS